MNIYSPNRVYTPNIHYQYVICMNNKHIHLFNFLIELKKKRHFCTLIIVNTSVLQSLDPLTLISEELSEIAVNNSDFFPNMNAMMI